MATETTKQIDFAWARLGDESDAAFFSFREYLALGPQRNMESYVSFYSKLNNKNVPVWYVDFRWDERAKLYDAYVLENMDKGSEDSLKFLENKQKGLLECMRILADKKLKTLINSSEEEITPYDTIRLIELSIKLEQLLQDKPTEIVEQQGEPTVVIESVTVDPDIIKKIGRELITEDID